MKLTRLGFIVVLLVIIGSTFNGEASERQNESVKNITGLTGPQKVVWDYFEAYLAWLEYNFNQRDETVKPIKPIPNRSLYPNFVTQHFIDSYNKLIQADRRMTPPGDGWIFRS